MARCSCGKPVKYRLLGECGTCYNRRKYQDKTGKVASARPRDLDEAKQKIMAYELGKPRTYVPTHTFPVTIRYVEPKPRPKGTGNKPSDVKTVSKPQVRQTYVKVRVCECGTPIDRRAARCRVCANKSRTVLTTVCPKCGGTKDKQSKQCRNCYGLDR